MSIKENLFYKAAVSHFQSQKDEAEAVGAAAPAQLHRVVRPVGRRFGIADLVA